MSIGGKPTGKGAWLRILCAVALLFLGIAHEQPTLAAPSLSPDEIAQYTLPDGTLPVMCLNGDQGRDTTGHHDFGTGCEACRLDSSTTLAARQQAVEPVARAPLRLRFAVHAQTHSEPRLALHASPRAPPLHILSA